MEEQIEQPVEKESKPKKQVRSDDAWHGFSPFDLELITTPIMHGSYNRGIMSITVKSQGKHVTVAFNGNYAECLQKALLQLRQELV